ncbi:hypothetical protein PS6_000573 [Mucor atramentarius]
MFNKTTTSILFLFAFLLSMASALVINPKITTPNSVKWETTYNDGTGQQVPIPDGYKGTIKLGYLENNDPYNEHLKFGDLAKDFALNAGSQTITLPADLETKTSYIIVLMGNSGNASPKFTIQAAR